MIHTRENTYEVPAVTKEIVEGIRKDRQEILSFYKEDSKDRIILTAEFNSIPYESDAEYVMDILEDSKYTIKSFEDFQKWTSDSANH